MFEPVSVWVKVAADGKVHLELPSDLPPNSEVEATVTLRPRLRFSTDGDWRRFLDDLYGSIPDLQRPAQPPVDAIEPL
jgi:hypothetical protein